MSIDYLHYVASYKKDIKNPHSNSDKHISLPRRAHVLTHSTNNKNLTKIHPGPYVKKNKKYRVLLAESNSGVRAVIKLNLKILNIV